MRAKVGYRAISMIICFSFLMLGSLQSAEARTIWRLQDTMGKKWGISIDDGLISSMDQLPLFESQAPGAKNIFLEFKNSVESVLKYDAFVDSGLDTNKRTMSEMMNFMAALKSRNNGLVTDDYQRIQKEGRLVNIMTNLLYVDGKWEMNKQAFSVYSIDRIEMVNISPESSGTKWVAIFHMKIRDAKGWLASEYAAVFKARNNYYVIFSAPGEW
jgi:hypothetical protein